MRGIKFVYGRIRIGMYRALYRKYRPATFSEVSGQSHVTETLKNELRAGRISHAYLFTGSRGTGKTSCAHILAKAVNCLSPKNGDPCLECESCKGIASGDVMDIMEIDAASNNGVDNIRDLRERVQFTPEKTKYRVYIIDEVHMLTTGAFNALLKTLEEPPEHVVFILATTEVHRLPATVLSRCQRFDFKRIEVRDISARLKYVCEMENLSITDEAADLIAVLSDGGMRDALSILDQCAGHAEDITENIVRSVCGMAGREYRLAIAESIIRKDPGEALSIVEKLHSDSIDATRLCSELLSHFRDLMIIKTVKEAHRSIACSSRELEELRTQAESVDLSAVFAAMNRFRQAADRMAKGNRRLELEMAIIELCGDFTSDTYVSASKGSAVSRPSFVNNIKPEKKETVAVAAEDAPPWVTEQSHKKEEPSVSVQSKVKPAPEKKQDNVKDGSLKEWDAIMRELGQTCPLLCGYLDGSAAYIDGDYLLIDCANPDFRNLLRDQNPVYKDFIKKAAQKVTGKLYKLGPYTKRETKTDDPFADLINKLNDMELPEKY